jgi:uncharacterized membrane protein YdfJ with MMPL/SSD domain
MASRHVVTENRNLAARAGRWSAQHRKIAIWGWLGCVLVVFVIGNAAQTVTQENAQSGVGESGRASVAFRDAFPKHVSEEVLIHSAGVQATAPAFRAVVADVQRRLAAVPYTRAFESPYAPRNRGRISADGHSALLRFEIAGKESEAKDRVGPTLRATSAAQGAHPGFSIEQFGEASAEKQITDVIGEDFQRALVTSLPITLVILLITFGALVAASIPLILALTAVMGTIGIVALISHISPVDQSINEVILLIGLAVTSPQMARAILALRERAAANPMFKQPSTLKINPAHTVAEVDIPLSGNGNDSVSFGALAALRNTLIPATVGSVPGTTAEVTGETASSKDFNDTMKSHAPLVFAFVLSTAFLLLLVTFRSLIIPIKAIILNLLSVGAAYGVLVWIFQYGHLESLLDFKSTGSITSWMPLFLFVVLFGLSMDYHVFILSRIREAFDRGNSTEEAVAHGIKSTAGVVTSAAVVMVSVFAIFVTLSLLIFKQLGVGLAVAVLIDATLVRGVLLPATMKLLGDWNWYLPRWLEWLPHLGPGDGRGLPPDTSRPQPEAHPA